jgi:hypothetical protein
VRDLAMAGYAPLAVVEQDDRGRPATVRLRSITVPSAVIAEWWRGAGGGRGERLIESRPSNGLSRAIVPRPLSELPVRALTRR